MDTYSLNAAARLLGTTAPRLRRAVDRLGLRVARESSGAFRLTERQVTELARSLGVVPSVEGLSRIETQVLAALARAPRGLASVRAVARRAEVSPTAAGRALEKLIEKGLATRTPETLARGRAERAHIYRAKVTSPRWARVAPQLAKVRPPAKPNRRKPRLVPASLRHLFWNTARSQLDMTTSAPYIARRLLTCADLEGLAWGRATSPRRHGNTRPAAVASTRPPGPWH